MLSWYGARPREGEKSPSGRTWSTPAEKKPWPSGVMSHQTPSMSSVRKRPVAVVVMEREAPQGSVGVSARGELEHARCDASVATQRSRGRRGERIGELWHRERMRDNGEV